jgi:hypothetical protein
LAPDHKGRELGTAGISDQSLFAVLIALRQSLADDPDHRANHIKSQEAWRREHPRYWADYRRRRPDVADRNRRLQTRRDRNRRRQAPKGDAEPLLANMDALERPKPLDLQTNGEFWLVPVLANMDALRVKIVTVSAT